MKILIVSDTHGQEKNLEEVLKKEEPIDALIHLGDLEGGEDFISTHVTVSYTHLSGGRLLFLGTSLPVLLPHRQLSRPDSGRWRESVGLDHDGSDPLCDRHAGSREREKRKAFQNGREQCFVCPDLKRRSSGGERPDRSLSLIHI